jgi:uncharacterized ferredoxin-like protein
MPDMGELTIVAELMAVAARTAPKAMGQDFLVTKIVEGEECVKLGDEIIAYGERAGKKNFDRDGNNVRNSAAVLLIGIRDASTLGLNCGACGHPQCLKPNTFEGEFRGPNCALRILDMGIALGSAVKMASLLNVDNRIMYKIGAVARDVGLIDADFVMGIPMSAGGKSPYFDR